VVVRLRADLWREVTMRSFGCAAGLPVAALRHVSGSWKATSFSRKYPLMSQFLRSARQAGDGRARRHDRCTPALGGAKARDLCEEEGGMKG
jgi:hypothetical protein